MPSFRDSWNMSCCGNGESYDTLKRKRPAQLELFVAGSLERLVPDDHILACVDGVPGPADCHCASGGRPGIDLETAVRLMLAGFLLGIVHHRRLMRRINRPDTRTRSAKCPGLQKE